MCFTMHVVLKFLLPLLRKFCRPTFDLFTRNQHSSLGKVFFFLFLTSSAFSESFIEYQFEWDSSTRSFTLDGNSSPTLVLYEHCSYLIRSAGAEFSISENNSTYYKGDDIFFNEGIQGNGEYILLTPNQNTPRRLYYQDFNASDSLIGTLEIKEYDDLGLLKMNQPEAFANFGSNVALTDDFSLFASAPGFNENEGLVIYALMSENGGFKHESEISSPTNKKAFWGTSLTFDEFNKQLLIGSSNAGDFRGTLYAYSVVSNHLKLLFEGERMGDLLGWSSATFEDEVVFSALSVTHSTGGYFSVFTGPYSNPLTLHEKLQPSSPQFGNEFGYSLSFSGDRIAVGAPGEDDLLRQDCGAVYLFEVDGNHVENNKVLPIGRTDGGRFGHTVMFEDKFLFVGAPYGDGRSLKSGLVHIFQFDQENSSYVENSTLLPPNEGASQKFSQNLFALGNFVFISSPGSESYGVVYVFKRSDATGDWNLVNSIKLNQLSDKLSKGENISLFVRNGILAVGLEKESSEEVESGAVKLLFNPAWDATSDPQIPPFFSNNDLLEFYMEEDASEIVLDFNASLPGGETSLLWEITSSSAFISEEHFDINSSSGAFTFSPPLDFNGRIAFKLSLHSGLQKVEHDFEIIVTPVSDYPHFVDFTSTDNPSPQLPVATVGEDYNYTFNLFDADGDELFLTLENGELPQGVTLSGHLLAGLPQDDGNYTFQLTLSDGVSDINKSFTIEVFSENTQPIVSWDGVPLTSPATINLQLVENFSSLEWKESIESLNVTDQVGQNLSLEILEQPHSGFLSVPSAFQEFSTDLIRFTPSFNFHGNISFGLRINDAHFGKPKSFDLSFNVEIISDNSAPHITSKAPSDDVHENEFFQHTFEIFDTDEDFYEITFNDLPSWLKFDGVRTIFGKPSRTDFLEDNSGFFVTVTDQWGSASTYNYKINVIPKNYPPSIIYNNTPQQLIEFTMTEDGDPYYFELNASNPENNSQPLEWIISQDPLAGSVEILSQNSTEAKFFFTPDGNFSGSDSFEIIVFEKSDPLAQDKLEVRFTVLPTPDAPRFETKPFPGVVSNKLWIYHILGIDGDIKDYLSLNSLISLPDWLTLIQTGNRTWTLSGIPTDLTDGVPVNLRLTDGNISVDQNFTLTIISSIDDLDLIDSNGTQFTDSEESSATKYVSISLVEDSVWSLETLMVNAIDDIRISWSVLQYPENGKFEFFNGANGEIRNLSFVPDQNFFGTDFLSLKATDNYSSLVLNFDFNVSSQEDPFLFTEYPTGIIQSDEEIYDFSVTFEDGDGIENIEIKSFLTPSWISYEEIASTPFTQSFRFFGEPNVNQIGSHLTVLEVADNLGVIKQLEVPINVRFLNKPPIPNPSSISTTIDEDIYNESSPKLWRNIFSVFDEESNADEFIWSVVVQAQHGTARIDPTGSNMSYYPDANYSGYDSFSVGVYDNGGDFNSSPRQTIVPVSIIINPVNDLPVFRSSPPYDSNDTKKIFWNDEKPFSYEVIVEDSDWSWQGHPELRLLSVLPEWANWKTLGNGHAVLSGSPQWFNQGSFLFSIEAKSGDDRVYQNFELNIVVDDYPPRIVNRLGETIYSKIQLFILEDGSTNDVVNLISGLRAFNPDKASGESLRWLAFKQPTSGGIVSLSSMTDDESEYAGISDFSYSIPPNFNGIDRFSLVADEGDRTSEVFFEVNVKSIPDPPSFVSENPAEVYATPGESIYLKIDVNEPDQESVDYKLLYPTSMSKWLTIVSAENSGSDKHVTLGGTVPNGYQTHSFSLVVTDPTGRFSVLSVNVVAQ
jgi:hypothetical protein